ncbi:MAG: hypothetical protein KKH61_19270 [Gammaproteobacteria bacterium]|nr:hypothetical protein [Gammaproteobacteria bacterium]
MNMSVINTARAADAAVGVAVAGAGVSLVSLSLWLQIAAAIVAIIAGVTAAMFHFEGWRRHRRDRKADR